MPPQLTPAASSKDLGDAVLESVQHGGFPLSEQVASSPVPPPVCAELQQAMDNAQQHMKEQTRKLSHDAAPNVDEWITTARKLHNDVQQAQETARAIVQQHESSEALTNKIHDSTAKISLLYSEIAYSDTLLRTINDLIETASTLEAAQDRAVHLDFSNALDLLEKAHTLLIRCHKHYESIEAVCLLESQASQLRDRFIENMTKAWDGLVVVDFTARRVSFGSHVTCEPPLTISTVVEILSRLGILDRLVAKLCNDFDAVVLRPRFVIDPDPDHRLSAFTYGEYGLQMQGYVVDESVSAAVRSAEDVAEYLTKHLPTNLTRPVASHLGPRIAEYLIHHFLTPAIPMAVRNFYEFIVSIVQYEVMGLIGYLNSIKFEGSCQDALKMWIRDVERTWVDMLREFSMERLRHALSASERKTATVSRAVIIDGFIPANKHANADVEEDWSSQWGEDEEPHDKDGEANEEDDIDADAWGLEDDGEEPSETFIEQPAQNPNEGSLVESYTVTGIPEAVLRSIEYVADTIENAGKLHENVNKDICEIPGLLLSFYRSTVHSCYPQDSIGYMLSFNDSYALWFICEDAVNNGVNELFVNRIYDLTPSLLDFQTEQYCRTKDFELRILNDLFNGAMGFDNCTDPLFAPQCDNAVAALIDRFEVLKRELSTVAAPTFLVYYLGALYSEILDSFIKDITDMGDISEAESKQLHLYAESLFSIHAMVFPAEFHVPDAVPSFRKFEQLKLVLDSPLAHIVDAWNGELGTYFDAETIVDLIKALFAPSERRTQSIREIRK